jgi:hypothetical protein
MWQKRKIGLNISEQHEVKYVRGKTQEIAIGGRNN